MRRKISLKEPVTELRHVPIIENGEPLVDYRGHPRIRDGNPVWDYRRETLLRSGVAERLWQAADALPRGYGFSVIEGWRPWHIQRRMYNAAWTRWREVYPDHSEAALRRIVNTFTAPLSDKVPPPHSTGGVFDLVLCDEDGNELDMTAPFRRFQSKCYPFDAPGLSPVTLERRAIMRAALESAGITNYPSEHWHWSFGDQGWAYRGGHSHAIYGRTEPIGYEPEPRDDVEAELVWIGEERLS